MNMTHDSNIQPGATTAESAPRDEESGVLQRWSIRWTANMTGWHKDGVHPALLTYLPHILADDKNANLRVLVPLCGKTVDMPYFASLPSVSGVVGVEGIEQGIEEFISENPSLGISKTDGDAAAKFLKYVGTKVSILKGNFFDLDATESGGKFDLVWDRGSMVAIDPTLREAYIKILSRVISPGGKILLCAVDRRSGTEEAMSGGPPFSINEATVRNLYENEPWVESVTFLGEKDDMDDPAMKQRWEESGLTEMYETYFVIQTQPLTA